MAGWHSVASVPSRCNAGAPSLAIGRRQIAEAKQIQVGIHNFKPTLRKAAERHQAIEAYLAIHAGVSPEAIDEFDRAYEAKRKAGDDSEPGDDPKAPYRKQRQIQ
jgi:hypothetical protein